MSGDALVSCIMPTYNRRPFVADAVAAFLAQDYEARELVVVDDGSDGVADLIPSDPRVRYVREARRLTIGAKRNLACQLARGAVILHWDDDDWHDPGRIAYQTKALHASGADLCGVSELYFYDPAHARAFQYRYPGSRMRWVAGGSFCYRRSLWERCRFADVSHGEDTRFVRDVPPPQIAVLPRSDFYVARIHAGNTCPKHTAGASWHPASAALVRGLIDRFSQAARRLPAVARPAGAAPRLSVAVPVGPTGLPLLRRSVQTLLSQEIDPSAYEVVVAVDGGAVEPVRAALARPAGGPHLEVVASARPRGAALPHRNHARNAAARAARGQWLWFLDGDFLLPPFAVAHLLAEIDRLARVAPRAVPILSPVLGRLGMRPDEWLGLAAAEDEPWSAAQALPVAPEYSGFAERHRPGPPASEPCAELLEGFPCLPRTLFEALGGFDEAFVGWGGNKEELVRRLSALASARRAPLPSATPHMHLLTSVRALHQPHAADPGRALGDPLRRENAARFGDKLRDIEVDAPWWRAQRERAAGALRELLHAPDSAAGETVRADAADAPPDRAPDSAPGETVRADAAGGQQARHARPRCDFCVVVLWNAADDVLPLLAELAAFEESGGTLRVWLHENPASRAAATPPAVQRVCEERGFIHVRAPQHHTKETRWRWVDAAFRALSGEPLAERILCLPGDARLCAGFFQRCTELWQGIDDAARAALTLVVEPDRENGPCWTGVAPSQVGDVVRTQWVDEPFLAGARFFHQLQFRVPPVSPHRWRTDPKLSDGIGRGISICLHAAGLSLYRVTDSLVQRAGAPDRALRFVGAARAQRIDAQQTRGAPAAHAHDGRVPYTVAILTHDRPDLLLRLLDDLDAEAARGVPLDVRVYDDASTADYTAVRARLAARGFRYVRAPRNHGKRELWRWVTVIFADLRDLPAGGLWVMLPDDCRLASRFFERVATAWRAVPDPRKAALNLLVDAAREDAPCWTGVAPVRMGAVDLVQWVDLLFVAERGLLEAVGYAVGPISSQRWQRDPQMSSGVGAWLSQRLVARGLTMYRVRESLVAHVEARSELSPSLRAREPLLTVRFADGPDAARRLARLAPASAALASVPARASLLERAIESLLPQVDRLRVYLNGYAAPPAFLTHERIEVASSIEHGDRGDAAKFYWCEDDAHDYRFVCDDDIVYPLDYVSRMVLSIERYRRRAALGLHGILLRAQVRSYYRDRRVLHCTQALGEDRAVDVLGTSSAAWYGPSMRLRREDFALPNMADILFAIVCRRQGVPLYSVARPRDWLVVQTVPAGETIYERYRNRDEKQTELVNAHLLPGRVARTP